MKEHKLISAGALEAELMQLVLRKPPDKRLFIPTTTVLNLLSAAPAISAISTDKIISFVQEAAAPLIEVKEGDETWQR